MESAYRQFYMHKRLPLLDFTTSLFEEVALSKTLVVTVQHILEGNYILNEYLLNKGLPPENLHLLGKTYSTSNEVLELYREIGVKVHKASTQFNSHRAFNEQLKESVTSFWNGVKENVNFSDYEKIIVVDDGAELLMHINDGDEIENLVGVEWTSSGYEKLKNVVLDFPVMNVARSQAKLTLEAPMIADALVKKFNQYISESNLVVKKILIVGAGSIGMRVYQKMRDNFTVYRYDIEERNSDIGQERFETELGAVDAIIGCVGLPVILPKHYPLLHRPIILASASSSDVEFSAVHLRKSAPQTNNTHENIVVDDIHLLNCGFPVNFDGTKQVVPLEEIQLTEALVYGAVCLMKRSTYEPGLVLYDSAVQEKIVEHFGTLHQTDLS